MVVRKVQLEYCYESKLFAPSDDILTLQRNTFSVILPNYFLFFFVMTSNYPLFWLP